MATILYFSKSQSWTYWFKSCHCQCWILLKQSKKLMESCLTFRPINCRHCQCDFIIYYYEKCATCQVSSVDHFYCFQYLLVHLMLIITNEPIWHSGGKNTVLHSEPLFSNRKFISQIIFVQQINLILMSFYNFRQLKPKTRNI